MTSLVRQAWGFLLGLAVGFLATASISIAGGGQFGYVYVALGGLFAFASLAAALLPTRVPLPAPA